MPWTLIHPHTITDTGFKPFFDNSLDALSHLCRIRRQFFPKAAETWSYLTTEHVSTVFLSIWDELVSRELGRVSKLLLSSCGCIDHGGKMVSPSVLPEGSRLIQQWCLSLAFTHWDFPRLPEFFHNILLCRCWKSEVIYKLTLRNIFFNLLMILWWSLT